MIPSRGKYIEWWDRNKPKALPRFPYRVYKEWTTWNDFLGTNNKFQETGKKWRPLDEAIVWAHKKKFATSKQWMDWCRDNKEDLPKDIPARPDLVYDRWRSWNHWLGNKPVEKVEAQQEAVKRKVFYVIREADAPAGNVFTFGTEDGGVSALKDRWEREKFTVMKLFWFDPMQSGKIKEIIDALSTPYYGEERKRIVSNIHEVLWYLEMNLEVVRTIA